MKYRLMDILACPICKTFPLKLIVFKESTHEKEMKGAKSKICCEEYCSLNNGYVSKVPLEKLICSECLKKEIVEGIIICPECLRWFPIQDGIPSMLPDGLREKEKEVSILWKYKEAIPEEVLKNGKPFNLMNF